MKWRPISEAPMDGSWIIVCGGNPDEEYWYVTKDIQPMVVAKWVDSPHKKGWFFAYWDGDLRSEYENPTHWMPLPEPPEVG